MRITKKYLESEVERLTDLYRVASRDASNRKDKIKHLEEDRQDLQIRITRMEAEHQLYEEFTSQRIRDLTLRLDILTLTPEQIKALINTKHELSRHHDPIYSREDVINGGRLL